MNGGEIARSNRKHMPQILGRGKNYTSSVMGRGEVKTIVKQNKKRKQMKEDELATIRNKHRSNAVEKLKQEEAAAWTL